MVPGCLASPRAGQPPRTAVLACVRGAENVWVSLGIEPRDDGARQAMDDPVLEIRPAVSA